MIACLKAIHKVNIINREGAKIATVHMYFSLLSYVHILINSESLTNNLSIY